MSITATPLAAAAMRFGRDAGSVDEAGAFFLCGENLASYAITTDKSPRTSALELLAYGYLDRDDPRAVAASESGPRSSGVLEMTRSGNPSAYLGQALRDIDGSALPTQSRIHLAALAGASRENNVDLAMAAVYLDEIALAAYRNGAAPAVSQSIAAMSADCTIAMVLRQRERTLEHGRSAPAPEKTPSKASTRTSDDTIER